MNPFETEKFSNTINYPTPVDDNVRHFLDDDDIYKNKDLIQPRRKLFLKNMVKDMVKDMDMDMECPRKDGNSIPELKYFNGAIMH